jgi:hypothetical protein
VDALQLFLVHSQHGLDQEFLENAYQKTICSQFAFYPKSLIN